jgi:hypothetical protein
MNQKLRQEILSRSDYHRGLLNFIENNPGCTSDDMFNSDVANAIIPIGIREKAITLWIKQFIKNGEVESKNWKLYPTGSAQWSGHNVIKKESLVRLTESQLRSVIRESILSEMDFGMMPGHDPRDTGARQSITMEDVRNTIEQIDIPGMIHRVWRQKSDQIVEKILVSAINHDANVFSEGAQEGDFDRENGSEYDPDEHLRHGVMFQKNMDYVLGYEWGYENGDTWDGQEIPIDVMDDFIESKIESYKGRAKRELTKDALFHLYDSISPNRIVRKVWYAIKDMYKEKGFGMDLIKFSAKFIALVAVVEGIDLFVIPWLASMIGIPLPPGVFGIGEFVLPVAIPMLGAKLAQDFVSHYQKRSGNELFRDDIVSA